MASKALIEIIKQAETLTPEEQLYLIALLAGKARQAYRPAAPRRRWREICGAAPYPLVGEDAQNWVSRTRREDTESRERRWRGIS
jgi:hypothetical protein